jgi:hypothetical protein
MDAVARAILFNFNNLWPAAALPALTDVNGPARTFDLLPCILAICPIALCRPNMTPLLGLGGDRGKGRICYDHPSCEPFHHPIDFVSSSIFVRQALDQ